jgi:hypothetical protein
MLLLNDKDISAFWSSVKKSDGCWIWNGSRLFSKKKGKRYGVMYVSEIGQSVFAHRISFKIHKGDPTGKEVCHECDNEPCVNPDHLFLGSHHRNLRDSALKGRQRSRFGKKVKVLTLEQIREIQGKWIKFVVTYRMLAKEYGVSYAYINKIISGPFSGRKHHKNHIKLEI